MKSLRIAVLVFAFALTGARAQTPTAEPTSPAPATSQAEANKKLVEDCRAEAKAQGAKGPDMRKAVNECVARTNPKLAKRIGCFQDAKAQGMNDKDQIKAFVKSCFNKRP